MVERKGRPLRLAAHQIVEDQVKRSTLGTCLKTADTSDRTTQPDRCRNLQTRCYRGTCATWGTSSDPAAVRFGGPDHFGKRSGTSPGTCWSCVLQPRPALTQGARGTYVCTAGREHSRVARASTVDRRPSTVARDAEARLAKENRNENSLTQTRINY